MYNQPTKFPNKLKRPQPRPQFNPGLQAPINGGSTADVVTDSNGMVSASRPRPVPFSPSSDRTVEMNSPARFPQGNAGNPKLTPRFKGKPLM